MLFLRRTSDVFEQCREEIREKQRALGRSEDEFFVPEVARWSTIRHLHKDLGNKLNEALGELEDANYNVLDGVLGHIDFNRQVGRTRMRDQRLRGLIVHFDRYRLRLVGSNEQNAPLRLHQGRFCLKRVEQGRGWEHFVRWYTRQAERRLPERIELYRQRLQVEPAGVRAGTWAITGVRAAWAACSTFTGASSWRRCVSWIISSYTR
jgi:hypothetical protein